MIKVNKKLNKVHINSLKLYYFSLLSKKNLYSNNTRYKNKKIIDVILIIKR